MQTLRETNEALGQERSKVADFEAQLGAAMPLANVPTLLLLLVQLTGNLRWLEPPYQPERSRGVDDNDSGGLPEHVQDEIRAAAHEAILAWHHGLPVALPDPSAELLGRMMTVSEGVPIPPESAELMLARLRAFSDSQSPYVGAAVPQGFHALIIGAGMSGIGVAIKLKQAGVPYTIVEKQDDTAGVWHSHFYPGCSVDTPSHLYCYTFACGDWSRYFPSQAEIHEYFRSVAVEHGIYDDIEFSTEVISADYDEATHAWRSQLRGPDGHVRTLTTNVVISAVGVFNEPIVPDIPGLGTFDGPVVQTARWDPDVALDGKRVAVIGTGASAMQLVPAIADRVASLTIFQRTRQWAAPFPKFHKPVPDPIRFLLREVPLYQYWYRLRLSWIFDSKIYPSLHRDPNWTDPEHSINSINAGHRRYFTRYIHEQLGDRQDLAPKVIPSYPVYGKRMLLDNGWFRTLTRPHVELVDNADDGIDYIRGNTIYTRNGASYEVDVIVLATGYKVARMLATLPIRGRNGLSIREAWDDDDPTAYLGTVTPDFPNLFILYGPNTQLGHGGSFIFIMECQSNYVLDALRQMFIHNLVELECRRDVHDTYNATIQERHRNMIWTHPGMTTYVRNARGRVVSNNPWELAEFWDLLKHANLDDYNAVAA